MTDRDAMVAARIYDETFCGDDEVPHGDRIGFIADVVAVLTEFYPDGAGDGLLDASLRLMEHWDAPVTGDHPDGDGCVPAFEKATMDARQAHAAALAAAPSDSLDVAHPMTDENSWTVEDDSLDVERRIAAENSMLLDAHHRADARQRGPMGGGGPVGCPVCGAALDVLASEVTR